VLTLAREVPAVSHENLVSDYKCTCIDDDVPGSSSTYVGGSANLGIALATNEESLLGSVLVIGFDRLSLPTRGVLFFCVAGKLNL
jgi:hypothetical protein